MRPTTSLLVFIALLCTALDSLGAQAPVPLELGVRIRITAPSLQPERQVGSVVALGPDTLVLRTARRDEKLVTVSLPLLTRLEVSRGRHSRWRAVLRMAGGAVLGYATGEDCDEPESSWICFGRGATALIGAVLLAPIGALVGAIVPPAERWTEVPLEGQQVGVRLAVHHSGEFAIGVAVTF